VVGKLQLLEAEREALVACAIIHLAPRRYRRMCSVWSLEDLLSLKVSPALTTLSSLSKPPNFNGTESRLLYDLIEHENLSVLLSLANPLSLTGDILHWVLVTLNFPALLAATIRNHSPRHSM
jgi:hypothetical protein